MALFMIILSTSISDDYSIRHLNNKGHKMMPYLKKNHLSMIINCISIAEIKFVD